MPNAILSDFTHPRPPLAQGVELDTSIVLAVWLTVVVLLGAAGAFVTPAGAPPLPILIGMLTPLALFFVAFSQWRGFRELVLTVDLRLITAIQAWRFGGATFLVLYAYELLPGLFAWPAGLGDIAIGATAPWIAAALLRRPGFASSKTFAAWNVLGIFDLVVAVGTGALSSALASGGGEITTASMALLPLVLVPAYLVPIFIMLHIAALLQARRLASRPGSASHPN